MSLGVSLHQVVSVILLLCFSIFYPRHCHSAYSCFLPSACYEKTLHACFVLLPKLNLQPTLVSGVHVDLLTYRVSPNWLRHSLAVFCPWKSLRALHCTHALVIMGAMLCRLPKNKNLFFFLTCKKMCILYLFFKVRVSFKHECESWLDDRFPSDHSQSKGKRGKKQLPVAYMPSNS